MYANTVFSTLLPASSFCKAILSSCSFFCTSVKIGLFLTLNISVLKNSSTWSLASCASEPASNPVFAKPVNICVSPTPVASFAYCKVLPACTASGFIKAGVLLASNNMFVIDLPLRSACILFPTSVADVTKAIPSAKSFAHHSGVANLPTAFDSV